MKTTSKMSAQTSQWARKVSIAELLPGDLLASYRSLHHPPLGILMSSASRTCSLLTTCPASPILASEQIPHKTRSSLQAPRGDWAATDFSILARTQVGLRTAAAKWAGAPRPGSLVAEQAVPGNAGAASTRGPRLLSVRDDCYSG